MGCSLLDGNKGYPDYEVYRRSRMLTALTYLVFAAGFIAHSRLEFRLLWPAGASALSVGYFHMARSYSAESSSLLGPGYLARIVIRDVAITRSRHRHLLDDSHLYLAHAELCLCHLCSRNLHLGIIFSRTLLGVRRLTKPCAERSQRPLVDSPESPDGHRLPALYPRRCYLIVIFGLGSIVITAASPPNSGRTSSS